MKTLFNKLALVVCLLVSMSPSWAQAKTPEELLTSVLKALEAKDAGALKALAISGADVKKFVWPAVAGNVSATGMSVDQFVTSYERSSNDFGIPSALTDLGGKKLQLVKVELPKPLKETEEYKLYASPSLTVKTENGQEKVITLVGGMLAQAGIYRVSTYYAPQAKR